ncbi:hypothetical protein Y1Q_0000490 [Alligator mississippiensis]|uniref:Secreted protein n=1 Tax=Alligator mississippiensis TaxID=8496 RepID=A0A151MBC1_ALLMI|nr:hypothetical protein Y1Q_0000490 [Alligator mississippiensis]
MHMASRQPGAQLLQFCCLLVVVERLVCPSDPQSYVTWSLILLAGSGMAIGPEERFQENHGPHWQIRWKKMSG